MKVQPPFTWGQPPAAVRPRGMREGGSGQLRGEGAVMPWGRDTVPGGWRQGEGAARAGVVAQWVD